MSALLYPHLLEILACPRDGKALLEIPGFLVCPEDHRYAIVEGVPIMLRSDVPQTHIEAERALAIAEEGDKAVLPRIVVKANEVDPFVQNTIAATNGGMYIPLIGKLKEYPIPKLRMAQGNGALFLDVGCNWGRWCIAASRRGYRPVGIDPSLKSIRSAYRVTRQLGLQIPFVVGDGRYLPFADLIFDRVFSYSVLQHLSKENCLAVLREVRRVLKIEGQGMVQMPNVFGIRSFYNQLRRGFRPPEGFDVRYWTRKALLEAFSSAIGPSQLSVDGYFSLDAQISDIHLLPRRYRPIVYASEGLRKLSAKLPWMGFFADSLYVTAARCD